MIEAVVLSKQYVNTAKQVTALIEFGKRYLDSKTGDIPWKHFPEALQSVSITRIPAVRG
jgi:predicted metal-binding protein